MDDCRPVTAPAAPGSFDLKSITNDPVKMGKYTPRTRQQTFNLDYNTSYSTMCQHLEGHRSPIPPGYTGHQPGTLFKFGFGNPGSEREAAAPEPDAFVDAGQVIRAQTASGQTPRSSAHCRVPFDSYRLGSNLSSRESPRKSDAWKKSGSILSPRPETRSGSTTPFFRAEPPKAPPPTVGYMAMEFPEEVVPVKYMETKGRPVHFWPYYRPGGGKNLTPSPGAQYPPHPPDTLEKRDMKSSYTNAFLKNMKKVIGSFSSGESTPMGPSSARGGMPGGYENNFTPLQAAWQGDDEKKKDFNTSYKCSFTRAAVSPRRRKMRF